MGMTIEKCLLYEMCNCKTASCAACKPDKGCPIYRYFKELIIQNYNARLKADMVDMLTELQLEIEELYPNPELNTYYRAVDDCSNLIQQKIDALKAESEPQESKDNKCPCYDCKHFEKEGWSHCKIHEWALGDSKCSDYEE